MSRLAHPSWLALALLVALAACSDTTSVTSPLPKARISFAQGDNATWTVTTTSDVGDGSCTDAHCTLREALAAVTDGGKIVFASSVQRTESSRYRTGQSR